MDCYGTGFIGSLLTWERSAALNNSLDKAQGRYLMRMAGQLSAVLAELVKLGHKNRAVLLREHLFSLPAEALFRLLLAPETHRRLTLPLRNGTSLLSFLEGALIAEECRAGLRLPPRRGVWTADGASFFCDGPAGNRIAKGVQFAAPVIAMQTVVDVASPHARLTDRNNVSTRSRRHSNRLLAGADLEAALAKLQAATRAIAQTSVTAYNLVSRALRVLVLTHHPQYDHVFQSVSTRAVVGRAVIVNAHMEHATVARLADALVHEAIHAFLYEIEQAGRWVNKGRAKRVIVSPWTGNTLALDSFVHACFVWFALARFWGLPEAVSAFPEREARYLRERAEKGFAEGEAEGVIKRSTAKLRQGFPGQLHWLFDNAV